MEGKHITVSVGNLPPYINLIKKNGKPTLHGYLGKIWNILQSRLHFTSELIGEDFVDGVFKFKNGYRDVILHPSIVSSGNSENYDLTVPLLSSWYSLYIKDSDEANSSQSYIRNWSIGLWACTALMIIIFTAFLYLMLNIIFRFLHKNIIDVGRIQWKGKTKLDAVFEHYKLRSLNEASLGNCFIIALAAFCSQGYHLSTRMTSTRMLMLTILIFGMIMSNSYSALLVSQLTLRERFLPFKTLDEIPNEASDYSLCVREKSLPYRHFTVNETSTDLEKKWSKIVNRKPCVKGIIPAEVMCAPQIAFLETPAIMQESIARNFKCKITHLKEKYYKVEFTILLLKGFDSNAKQAINYEIIKYREVGILRHLIKRYVRQDELLSPANDPVLQVTFDHVQGVLLVYACCIGVSFFFLLTEILFVRVAGHVNTHEPRKIFRFSQRRSARSEPFNYQVLPDRHRLRGVYEAQCFL